jgi:hypothetical protein
MPSYGILCRVALATTDVSGEHIAFIIRMTRICELDTLAVTSDQSTYIVFLRTVLRLLVTANVVSSS